MKNILFLLLAILMGTMAVAQEDCCNEAPYFELQASAEKRITPDEAYLGLNIREIDEKRNPINMAKTEKDLLQILDRLNISLSNLKVSGLSGIQQKINRR